MKQTNADEKPTQADNHNINSHSNTVVNQAQVQVIVMSLLTYHLGNVERYEHDFGHFQSLDEHMDGWV